jgi:Uma2 family endonuclease
MADIAIHPQLDDGYVRKKWTVSEFRKLVENGLLDSGRFELVEGEILFKMGQGRLHVFLVARIIAIMTSIFGDSVQSQAAIGIGEIDEHNDPEPDVTVLKELLEAYIERDPDPMTDVLLAIEIADSTLRGDSTTKANLYARSGVQEYWVISVRNRQLIVHRNPTGSGYASVQTLTEGDSVSPLSAPKSQVNVSELLWTSQ